MNSLAWIENEIEKHLLNVRTAYLGKVIGISGNEARVLPLTMYQAKGGTAKVSNSTTAIIPKNIKTQSKEITTESGAVTVLVPASLSVGDIVFVGVCDRDISYAKNGVVSKATARHHDINDGVILRVL